MKIFVFDTETTGLPQLRHSPNENNFKDWPYIVQLSFIVYDDVDNKITTEYNSIIKLPENVKISEEASNIHCITNGMCEKVGHDLKDVLKIFKTALETCDVVVAHNMDFDVDMILTASLRSSVSVDDLLSKKKYCTMANSKNICNIQAKSKNGGTFTKYPTLKETHTKLFSKEPNNLHNAFNDVIVCLRCYCMLVNNIDLCKNNKKFNALYKKNCM